MVSDQEIADCVETLLFSSSSAAAGIIVPGGVSLHAVIQQAQAKLGVDLSHKAAFIRDQIELFLGSRLAPTPPPPLPLPLKPSAPPPIIASSSASLPQQSALMLQQQQQQPHLIYQQAPPAAGPPPVPAMAFYPPPPLAMRYASTATLEGNPLSGAAIFQPPPMPSPTMVAAASSSAADPKESSSTEGGKRRRGGPGGLNKVCAVSPELQAIIGETLMARTQIVKQLWAYIRKNNLQDPEDKRKINCNDELRVVFGTDSTDMFKMNKLLAKHITPLNQRDQFREAKKQRVNTEAGQSKPKTNQNTVVLSDALAKFIGTERRSMVRDDAVKFLWDYIRENQLEDVTSSLIICDPKLLELFRRENIPSTGLLELLERHFLKKT